MSGWPAYLGQEPDEPGTHYVSSASIPKLIERYKGKGWAWRFNERFTTYKPDSRRLYKSLDSFSPDSPEDFWHIMESARLADCGPPSSFADLWRKVSPQRIALLSVSNVFRPVVFGGWQHANPGEYRNVFQYDLNFAYRSAAIAGRLPDTRSARPSSRIEQREFGCYLVELPSGALPYRPHVQRAVVTVEEIEYYKLRPLRVVSGVVFDRGLDFSDLFATIDTTFPYCHKRISRAFWGSWNSVSGPEQLAPATGSSRRLPNPFYNPVWSAYVTSRVKMRLARHAKKAIQIFVDAVWLPMPMDSEQTGESPGSFRLVKNWPTLTVRYAGSYGSANPSRPNLGGLQEATTSR